MIRTWANRLKSSWHHSLSLLWLMIIAVQWLSYTEPVWLQETTAAVLLTLAAVAVIEILLPVRLSVRLLVEAAAVLYLLYRVLTYYKMYNPDPYADAGTRLRDLVEVMAPYAGFVAASWFLLLLLAWWVSSKTRVLLFIGMNLAAFAALDSFTPVVLWQEVAWTFFAGMGWLVSGHMRKFQLRYPRGWSYLLRHPFKIAVNIAIIFSLVILTGVNMPKISPSLTDPYTAWREWKGLGPSTGIGTIGRTASESGTDLINRTSSGYSLDDSNLGGGFSFDYTPIMAVTSELRTYMRGETRNVYSGKGWIDNDRVRRGNLEKTETSQLLKPLMPSKVTTRSLQQTVKRLTNTKDPVLFGAYSIASVDSVNGEASSEGLFWRSRDSELLWDTDNEGRNYPQNYVLTVELPIIPVQELKARSYQELYGNDIDKEFLQLPDKFPARVKELAAEVTAAGQTPYEKTALLQQYLQETFPYTNHPDASDVKSPDFVESFLFEIKEGYCDYYSTAMVTMARSLGIPARWVKGYAPGEQSELPVNVALQQGDAYRSYYTITNADAHSWAEVYFGDYGWIPVEATPGFNAPLLTQNEQEPEQKPEETQPPETEPSPKPNKAEASPGSSKGGPHFFKWLTLSAAIILLAWVGYLLWQHRFNLRFLLQRLQNGRPLSPDQKVVAETERWLRYVRRKGLTRGDHETLREAVQRWSRERPAAKDSFEALLTMFEKAKYSPEVIEDKDWRSVYTEALRLRKNVKPGK